MATLMHALKTALLNSNDNIVLSQDDTILVQNRLLCILDDFLDICNNHGLRYMMGGGSALGTVRHHGFIPWDDDIDINMPREDAEKFIPLFIEKYGDKYWVILPGEPENTYQMIHILTKDVRARGIMQPSTDDWGLCFDIFVIENTYDNPLRRKLHGYRCLAYRYVLSCLRFRRNRDELRELAKNGGELAGYIRRRLALSNFLSVIPLAWWSKSAEKCVSACKNKESHYVTIPSGMKHYFGEMYERSTFCELVEMDFEGRKVLITSDYDRYLTRLYKNYMEIPPVEKREKHVMRELDIDALRKYRNVRRNIK